MYSNKQLETKNICMWFAFSFLVIPLFVGFVLLYKQLKENDLIIEKLKLVEEHDIYVSGIEHLKQQAQELKSDAEAQITALIEKRDSLEKNLEDETKQLQKKLESYKAGITAEKENRKQALEEDLHEMEIIMDRRKQLLQDELDKYKRNIEEEKQSVKKELELEIKQQRETAELELKKIQDEIDKAYNDSIIKDFDTDIYDGLTSAELKDKLELIKLREHELIKSEKAFKVFTFANKKTIYNPYKQIRRCFDAEFSKLCSKVKMSNMDTSRQRLTRLYQSINSIFSTDGVALTEEYLKLKYEQLNLYYLAAQKEYEEQEQKRIQREQLIEEEKVRKEIEREKERLFKEETQFKNEINRLMRYLNKASVFEEKQLYIDKIKEFEEKIKELEGQKSDILNREQNTRAGYVYIISNIGSFGENIYKIGVTRRLDPMERIRELSDASVPFEFDVHAMIFSDDAPALENVLHTKFKDYKVNKVNRYKEFFNIGIDEIRQAVIDEYNPTVKFVYEAPATEYRESVKEPLCI